LKPSQVPPSWVFFWCSLYNPMGPGLYLTEHLTHDGAKIRLTGQLLQQKISTPRQDYVSIISVAPHPHPQCPIYSEVCQIFCPGWPATVILPISASRVARITDLSYLTQSTYCKMSLTHYFRNAFICVWWVDEALFEDRDHVSTLYLHVFSHALVEWMNMNCWRGILATVLCRNFVSFELRMTSWISKPKEHFLKQNLKKVKKELSDL
jgi:hypothetical protein